MLQGLMMRSPLLISSLITHADRHHGDVEVVSRRVEGDIHRTTYRELHRRSRQLANALDGLGLRASDRVATLAWNGYRHLELYFAVSGSGAVLHTINPRLHPEQIAWIVNHAEDRALFFDVTFLPLIEAVAPHCRAVQHWVAMADRAHMPTSSKLENLLCYEEVLGSHSDHYTWPEFDENSASSMCYTSGTTGNPKGVLYSHRSTVLHSLAAALPDALNVSARDVILPVVPMFHVNAWGLPYVAPMVGCKMVFPGPAPRRQVPVRTVRNGKGDLFGRRADGLAGTADLHRRPGTALFDDESDRHRRLGLPAGDDTPVRGKVRRARAARLGHDRDEPARHRLHVQA